MGAWQCKRYQKKRLKAKCIDSFSKISQKWKDITIKYSGYMPKNGQFGKEYIHIVGKSKHAFMIRAFAYEVARQRSDTAGTRTRKCAKLSKRKNPKRLPSRDSWRTTSRSPTKRSLKC